MGSAFSSGTARRRPRRRADAHGLPLVGRTARERASIEPGVAAWLAAVPAAAITIAAMVLLGPSLGAVLFPSPDVLFWPALQEAAVHREPTEQARFLIALSAPLLLAGLTVLLTRRGRIAPATGALLARTAEVLGVVVVVGCFVAQRLQAPRNNTGDTRPVVYFTLASIVVAIAIATTLALALRSAVVRAHTSRWIAETRWRRVGATTIALVAIVVGLLPAINTDGSIAHAYEAVLYHLLFTYDEASAVLNGRSPLGNFAAQYASLWPYPLALLMSVLGSGLAVFTGLLAALTGATLLALYDLLRRLTRSSIAALLLFLPLLATCGFRLHGPAVNRFSLINYFGVMPLRYAAPFLLAWLVVRHLDGARPRRVWPLFLVAGLTVLNNTDFGLPALGATVAALVWTHAVHDRRGVRRELLEAVAGLTAAVAAVTVLVLARTGAMPDFSLLFRYARVFVLGGFAMLRIKPLVGVDIAIFLTHVAAIGVATVRALRRDRERALTGTLVWSGVFGLGAGSYYVGHSLSELLIYTFPCWALSIVLLTFLTIRTLARTLRLPSPAELACLVAFGLLACSLAQTPAPWQQLARITSNGPHLFAHANGQEFVAQNVAAGERVVIVALLGHRIAQNLHVSDLEPFTGPRSMFTVEQLRESLTALREAGGTKVFVERTSAYEDFSSVLRSWGYTLQSEEEGMQLWLAG